jgi:hypothetical protein
MDASTDRARRTRALRSLAHRIDQHLRLQRELLWHPRLGLAGPRAAAVRIPVARRNWIRR